METVIFVDLSNVRKFYSFNPVKFHLSSLFAKILSRSSVKSGTNNKKLFHVLKDISFKLEKGNALGVIGVNGSGKSTLLQIISGVLRRSSGEISIRGRVASVLELGAGFDLDFTGIENIFINASCYGMTRRQTKDVLNEIIDFADIGEYINRPVKTYSSGMISRLAFAIMSNVNADILLIDEALSVGDAKFSLKCLRFIKDFKKHGIVIFVSHDANTILSICDECIWIDDGLIRSKGDPRSVLKQYNKHIFSPIDSISEKSDYINNDVNFLDSNISSGRVSLNCLSFVEKLTGSKESTVNTGSDYLLRLSFLSEDTIHNVVVGFIITNKNGVELIASDSRSKIDPISLHSCEQKNIDFSFYLPKLTDGTYSISIGLIEEGNSGQITHLFLQDYYFFEVTNCSSNGILQLEDLEINTY